MLPHVFFRDRIRRSPGLAEVFFRDAAKDVFNKNTSEECKPYESSYSKGCPPADWCLGCTVCDCDANGRWDCHTLSFCTDDKGKKKMRNKITKPQALKKKAPTTIKKQKPETSKKPNKYHPPKNIIKAKGKQLSQINEPAKSQSKFTKKRNKPKNLTIKKAKAPVYKKKPTPKSNEKSNSKIIKKSMQPSSVQIVKGNTKTLKDNEEVMRDIAHTIYKKVMDAVEKIVMDSKKNISHKKNLQKQHCLHKGKRSKREITSMISTATDTNTTEESFVYQSFDSGVMLATPIIENLTTSNYFKYIVDLKFIKRNTTKYKEKHTKVNNEIKNNDKVALEVYTKNIIENLRKLKNLAQKFGIKNRPKREAMEDDGLVEYLLILMEYLLKQKKQLRISPVSDGIDLLINAIKSAPDIKVSRKKVLEYVPARVEEETTESILTLPNAIKMDETNNTASYAVPKFKTFESMDEDEENSDYYQYYKKEHKSNNFNWKENGKGYELFTDEPEEDDGDVLTTTKPLDIISKSLTHHIPTRIPLGILENGQSTSKQANDAHIHNSRIKLSWIEESYNQEEERKELPRFTETTTQKQSPTHAALVLFTRTRVNKKAKLNKYDDPISSISKEITDEESKRTKYFNSEYVMYKKQMNFLNSLDYGTEKIDIDGDSKEDKPNVEQFPLYFV
ncbi:jg17200 [Pararge aegeria aegeria]|uniref:Jg17200 protein n=1 Tax=Pararge aegeria aegeria TaxID=348720 RepID=A0A8S4S9N2_9NEOP|nr:jg17200 [Pararge aegeria aegeria]